MIGTLKMNKYLIAIHSMVNIYHLIHYNYKFTMSIFGIFFAYTILEALFSPELTETSNEHAIPETALIFMLSCPYFIDFVSGLTTFYLFYLILKEEKRQKNLEIEEVNFSSNIFIFRIPNYNY